MQIINQNILDVTKGIICHQVNCKKVMGAGLALKIKKKWPVVYERYMEFDGKLGDATVIKVDEDLYVANLYGQNYYGRGEQNTDYDALRKCFNALKSYSDNNNVQVYIPHGIGCGLGGGVWSVIYEVLEEEIPTAILCKYNVYLIID